MSTKITLEHPITQDGQTITSVELRRPTVGDRLEIDKKPLVEQDFDLIVRLTGLAPDAVRQLDLATDWQTLLDTHNGFFSSKKKPDET